MKNLFYRLSSSRSFTKLFSTHARLEERKGVTMSYRKLISALVFAAFGFWFSGEARAQGCDNPDFCWDFGIPSVVDNITGSSVKCVLDPGGASQPFNTLDIGTGPGTADATFTQTGTATCTHLPNGPSNETCAFELTMAGVTTSTCTTSNSFNAGAFCQDNSLTVTGKITCPSGVMNLGIAGMPLNKNQCEAVFPLLKQGNTVILPAGKVLAMSITTDGSTGACKGPFVAISNVAERYCNSGDLTNGAVDCTPQAGPTRTTTPETTVQTSVVPFDFDVPQTVNTSPTFCKDRKAIDKGAAKLNIFGSNFFDVDNVDQGSLLCAGASLACDPAADLNGDGILDLPCRVNTCPAFGPNLGLLPRNDDRTVTATCTGKLNSSGTPILGMADVDVSPK